MNIFDSNVEKYELWYENHKSEYLAEIEALKKVIPKKGKGLEVGVGTGRFASMLGIEFGIDPSEKMLEIAKKRGIKTFNCEGENLPFEDESFDFIAIIITICFVKNPLKVISEAKRVLRENGKIIIGIIDKNSFLGREYQNKESVFYKVAHFFSTEEIDNMLFENGFKNIEHNQALVEDSFVVISGEKNI
jgi:ubiquinone/menaquinone biosynthesis C-methylase UbiE